MKDGVVFQANVPKTFALASQDGIQVAGRFGAQVMYPLMDERVMYVPLFVRDRIGELSVRQGEPFSICKSERRGGNRRLIVWLAGSAEIEDQKAAADGVVPAAGPGSNGASKVNGWPNDHGDAARNGGRGSEALLRSALILSVEAAIAPEHSA
jgi:hypothetical protein